MVDPKDPRHFFNVAVAITYFDATDMSKSFTFPMQVVIECPDDYEVFGQTQMDTAKNAAFAQLKILFEKTPVWDYFKTASHSIANIVSVSYLGYGTPDQFDGKQYKKVEPETKE